MYLMNEASTKLLVLKGDEGSTKNR